MSIITNKFIYIHIPRTGGTSVEQVIGGAGHRSIEKMRDVGMDRYGNEYDSSLPVWCFVRNPYDRFVSAWSFFKVHKWFNDDITPIELSYNMNNVTRWLRHFRPQYRFVAIRNMLMAKHYKYENFSLSWEKICNEYGIGSPLIRTNQSKHEPWQYYYYNEPEFQSRIYEAYKTDFELFGYDREIR